MSQENFENVYQHLKQRAEIYPQERTLQWEGTKLSHLYFGMMLPGFFLEQKPVLLLNPTQVQEEIEKQKLAGLTKSYEMVLLQMNNRSIDKTFPEVRRDHLDIDVYLTRPVRKATPEEIAACDQYEQKLLSEGLKVWNPINTPQGDDRGGFTIVENHFYEIWDSKRMDCYWNGSTGSHVDLGTALMKHFSEGMKIKTFNRNSLLEKGLVVRNPPTNIEELLLHLDTLAEKQ